MTTISVASETAVAVAHSRNVPDARYLGRSRVNPRSPETLYPTQTGRPRREQYWGGGSFGGYRYGD